MECICLSCGHRYEAYKDEVQNRRCPVPECRSYDVIESRVHDEIIADIKKLAPDGPLRLKTLNAIIKRRGLRFRPISTLYLVEKALDDVFSPTPVGATLGEASHPVKRVRKRF